MNPCCNSLTFVSRNLKLLKKLNQAMNEVISDPKSNTITNLLAKHNYTYNDITLLVDARDYIDDVDKVLTQKGKCFYFTAETVSSWTPNLLPLVTLLKEKYNSEINLISQSIEPGCGIYHTNDISGIFYPDRFILDFCYNDNYDTEYFEGWNELINYLEKSFPEADISAFDNLNTIIEAIRDKYETEADQEFFININMFTPYDDGESYRYYNQSLEVA